MPSKAPAARVGPRSAVVTGGASGIGRALGAELARAGIHVVLADRQIDLAEEAAAGIREQGGAALAAELDVRDLESFRGLVDATFERAGRLDYLFNNAGIGVGGEACAYDAADWDDVIDVNLRGVAHGILAAYPLMIRQGFGHIVNTASMAGLNPAPLSISYVATKHAVVGLSKTLRLEARRYGVKVSVLCPGAIRTPILHGGRYGRFKAGLDPAGIAERWEQVRPMNPARFAVRVLRAVERDRAIIIEPWGWRLLWYLDRLSPALYEKIAAALFRRITRELEARAKA